jgi:exopolysaccharide biosynthesis polyprenyl glycosylphosphotransferase
VAFTRSVCEQWSSAKGGVGVALRLDGRRDDDPGLSSGVPPFARRTRRGLNTHAFTVGLMCSDFLLAWASLAIGLLILSAFSRNPVNRLSNFWVNFPHGTAFPVGILLGMAISGMYRNSRRSPTQSTFSELQSYTTGIAFGGVLTLSLSYLAHHFASYTVQVATQVLSAMVVAVVLLPIGHALLRREVLRQSPVRVLIVDGGEGVARFSTHLRLNPGILVVGWVATTGSLPQGALGRLSDLENVIREHDVDRILIGSTGDFEGDHLAEYRRAMELADVALVPRVHELVSWRSRLTELSGLPLLETVPTQMSTWDRTTKRAFDLVGASVLLVLCLPLFVVIAASVKLTSPGPVFFRQERLGRHRRSFTILKFRSMRVEGHRDEAREEAHHANPEAPLHEARHKRDEVPHLTPIGGFLRRSGLDELPQFLNVLTGSMSLVGPRPFITAESEPPSGWSARRFDLRPGITGLWQVSGRNELTAEELRQLDYLYATGWALWWDVKICMDTPRAMIRGLGAY